ncbi:hypothetical protein J6590_088238 [Homalodisca vitripennis]|nr:hypothetical protein J6590_088238 [Homalodisca vitripennis]
MGKRSSVKGFRPRRNYSSPYNSDTRYPNKRLPRSSIPSHKSLYEPALLGYQLIGDSQFCRFGQQLLGLRRVSTPNSPGRIGICVSGQIIDDLHNRNAEVTTMCQGLSALLNTLQETVNDIVLLTLPPIPKLGEAQGLHHFALLQNYNNYIRSLGNGDNVRIADVSPLFMTSFPQQECRMRLFERAGFGVVHHTHGFQTAHAFQESRCFTPNQRFLQGKSRIRLLILKTCTRRCVSTQISHPTLEKDDSYLLDFSRQQTLFPNRVYNISDKSQRKNQIDFHSLCVLVNFYGRIKSLRHFSSLKHLHWLIWNLLDANQIF